MYTVPVPTFASHCLNSFATNSGRCPNGCFQVFLGTTSRRPTLRLFRISPVFLSRVLPGSPRKFIDQCQHPQRSSVMHHTRKVIGPNVIRTLGPQPHTAAVIQPQATAWSLFLWQVQLSFRVILPHPAGLIQAGHVSSRPLSGKAVQTDANT